LEYRPDIVMVGNADQNHRQGAGRQRRQQSLGGNGLPLAADRQYAPVHGKSGDTIHDGRRNDIDRQAGRRLAKDIFEAGQTVFQNQNGFGEKAGAGQQYVENHPALGDKAPLPPGQIAFADVEEGSDPRVGRVLNAYRVHGVPA